MLIVNVALCKLRHLVDHAGLVPKVYGPRLFTIVFTVIAFQRFINGSITVKISGVSKGGDSKSRVMKVPAELAQGIAADSFVEVTYDQQGIHAVRPLGAYRADVIIGRVIHTKDGLRLASLRSAGVDVTVFSDVLADPPELSVQAAVDAARAVGYVGAGTVEFIVNQDGIVYQKNLGAGTDAAAPVTSWTLPEAQNSHCSPLV